MLTRRPDDTGPFRWSAVTDLLRAEARLLASAKAPHLPPLLETGDEGAFFLATASADGTSLRSVIESLREAGAEVTLPWALHVGIAILEAIDAVHGLREAGPVGCLHRALSSDSLWMTWNGSIEITSLAFAASPSLFATSHLGSDAARGLLESGAIAFDQLAPEQLDHARLALVGDVLETEIDSVDGRADLFQAGLLLFELLTTGRPFTYPRDPEELRQLRRFGGPLAPAVSTARPDARPFDRIVGALLAPRAAERPGSAAEAPSELRAVQASVGHCDPASELAALLAPHRAAVTGTKDPPRAPTTAKLILERASTVPRILGGYELVRVMSTNTGQGIIYEARCLNVPERRAVVKVVKGEPESGTEIKRLMLEAQALRQIRHPNVVEILDVVTEGPAIVMEYIEGEALSKMLARERRLEPDLTIEIMSQVCSGVHAAHERDIVHRDLKPHNVMMTPVGEGYRVRVIDFGAAVLSSHGLGKLTKTGMIAPGTPPYMSPEQCEGLATTARSDVYAAGVMTFECLTGAPPFRDANPITVLMQHIQKAPPAFDSALPKEVRRLEPVVRQALEKNPSERFASMLEFAEALRAARGPRGLLAWLR